MRDKMARAGYEAAIRFLPTWNMDQSKPDDEMHRWENQSEALRATWFAVVDAVLDALLEPTEGMVAEAERDPDSLWDRQWPRMIRAAKEGK